VPAPGQHVAHFRILETIGTGGMGVVYSAEDTRLHRLVALKFLPDGFIENDAALRQLRKEALAAAALSHENVCVVHDFIEADGQHFIVMELLEGQTLQQVMDQRSVGSNEVLEIAMQIAAALATRTRRGSSIET